MLYTLVKIDVQYDAAQVKYVLLIIRLINLTKGWALVGSQCPFLVSVSLGEQQIFDFGHSFSY